MKMDTTDHRNRGAPMQTDEETLEDKLRVLGETHNAITRARRAVKDHPSPETAIALQKLQLQAKALRATLPPLRAVT